MIYRCLSLEVEASYLSFTLKKLILIGQPVQNAIIINGCLKFDQQILFFGQQNYFFDQHEY
jgi:hypothetical protein